MVTPTLQWTYITIFWRSIWQAGLATVLAITNRVSNGLLHSNPTGKYARSLGLFDYHPLLGEIYSFEPFR